MNGAKAKLKSAKTKKAKAKRAKALKKAKAQAQEGQEDRGSAAGRPRHRLRRLDPALLGLGGTRPAEELGPYERVEPAVEHPLHVADLGVGAVVLDHRVGVQHVGADL